MFQKLQIEIVMNEKFVWIFIRLSTEQKVPNKMRTVTLFHLTNFQFRKNHVSKIEN